MKQLKNSTWITVAGASLMILILSVVSPNALRIILSVPLMLFVPGFALTLILFPRKSLGIAERLLLSIGLSVAFTALSGLLLNMTPWGLQAQTLWIVLLLTIAVEIVVIFFTRRSWWLEEIKVPAGFNFNTRQWVLMVLAALMTIMAIQVARTPSPQQGLAGYTLLWVKPGDTANAIRVGVENNEFKATNYHIKYEFNSSVREGPTFQLKPGETRESIVPLPNDLMAGTSFIVLLYRLDNPNEVYRSAVWWPTSH